ncbi:DUF6114 domain-containing protein [Streptomyces sp. PLM4]|uniref:DUF6114 domain-containing protein n=1 Tax=Streptomyces sp. PLM4 TaxID=2929798 RepID=UPI00205EF90E|nr:DUF6114 domain-containing protein [Streptomyces sp. PLM4]BDH66651.1 hypothetical protein MTP06_01000 [Streptomyces sp. PLM4]
MAPETPPTTKSPAPAARARTAFRTWRRSRPFWGALWTGLGGFVILFLPLAPLGRILQVGIGGVAGMAAGALLMAMALLILLMPGQRYAAGIVAVVVGVASFPLTNLGGLVIGMVLAVLGGSMAFGWLPERPERRAGRGLSPRRRRPGGKTAEPAA